MHAPRRSFSEGSTTLVQTPTARVSARRLPIAIAVAIVGLFGSATWRVHSEAEEALPRSSAHPEDSATTSTRPAGNRTSFLAPERVRADQLSQQLSVRLAAAATEEEILTELEAIARQRPRWAIELAQRLGRNEEEKATWVTRVMSAWTAHDSEGAWSWVLQQPTEQLDRLANGTLLHVVCTVIAERDPQRLRANLATFLDQTEAPGGVAPLVAIHVGLEALGATGNVELARETVEAWARSVTPPEIGAAAYETVAFQLATTSAEKAGAWLKSLPPSAERDAALATFAGDWATRDPSAALRWAETLTSAEGRSDALARSFGDWAERSDADAGEWLGDFLGRTSDSTEADRLIATLLTSSSTIKRHPDIALRWASFLAESTDRAKIEERVLLRWARRDPSSALKFVAAAPTLEAERKYALLQKLHRLPMSAESSDIE